MVSINTIPSLATFFTGNYKRLALLAFLGVAGSIAPHVAKAEDALKMRLEVSKVVVKDDGSTSYRPVTTAKSGTVIQYKAIYSNTINQPINNVKVTLPIPKNMTFTGKAFPSSAQASIDGKNFADMPLMRRVNGELIKIPYSEYKTLRWHIKLVPANKSASVALNTVVD